MSQSSRAITSSSSPPADNLQGLSVAELLALLMNDMPETKARILADSLLQHYGGLQHLSQASVTDLQRFGISTASLLQLTTALELGRRLLHFNEKERPVVNSAADAALLVADMYFLPQEHVRAILLDATNRLIATPTIYIGTLNASVIRVAEIFREAITRNSPAFILAHNHPSGDVSPSPEDIELTRTLIAAGKLLDIQLLDHLIVGHGVWNSLKNLGLGF